MYNEYFVKVPSAYFHETPNSSSPVTDEVLFGTKVYTVDTDKEKCPDGWLFCTTTYGYKGYINISKLSKVTGNKNEEKYVVVSPFCDVLESPEYKCKPVFTLPRGSVLAKTSFFGEICGFCDVNIGASRFYVRSENIKSQSDLHKMTDEETKRRNIVNTALSYLDTPYRWGGKSASGIDCSGLCFMAYHMNGVELWRDAVPDTKYVFRIPFDELKEGDLVYYKGHVVMYIGGNEYIHSSQTFGRVCINSFDHNSPVFYEKLSHGIIMCARSVAFGN